MTGFAKRDQRRWVLGWLWLTAMHIAQLAVALIFAFSGRGNKAWYGVQPNIRAASFCRVRFASTAERSTFISHPKQRLRMQSQDSQYGFRDERVESFGEVGTENSALAITLVEDGA